MFAFHTKLLVLVGLSLASANAAPPEPVPLPDLSNKCTSQNLCGQLYYANPAEVLYFSKDSTKNLAHAKELIFYSCNIANVPVNIFHTLPQLEEFIMVLCEVQHVPAESFEGANKLRSLDLSNNRISSLESHNFALARQLEELDLRYNHLEELPAQVFAGLRQLKKLVISNNNLKTLSAHIFADLLQLQDVDVGFNRLRKLPAGLFGAKHHLKEFAAPNNELLDISPNAFEQLQRLVISENRDLQNLKLTGNISELQAEKCGLVTIQLEGPIITVNLRHNRGLKNVKLAHPQMLENLYLGHTKPQSFSFLSGASELQDLDLSGIDYLPALPEPWPATKLVRLSVSHRMEKTDWFLNVMKQMPNLQILDIADETLMEVFINDMESLTQVENFFSQDQVELVSDELADPSSVMVFYD